MDAAANGLGRLLTADQLATEWGRSRRWIYRQLESGGLPSLRFGRQVLFQEADVADWLESKRADCESTPNPRSKDLCLQTETPPPTGGAPKTNPLPAPKA